MIDIRLAQLLGVLCLLWLVVPVEPCLADGHGPDRGLLFEVTSSELDQPSYLFGTIHSDDARVMLLPATVQRVFDRARGLALEVIPDESAGEQARRDMIYADGRRLEDVLTPMLYRNVRFALMESGLREEDFEHFKPWAAMLHLSAPPSSTGDFLDFRLYRQALNGHKQTFGLEAIGEQLSVFDTLSEAEQVDLLSETLRARPRLPGIFERLIEAYLHRDLAEMETFGALLLREGDPRLSTRFQALLVDARNHNLVERMVPLLDEGGWLIAIGALHIAGETGIYRRLRAKGYHVRRLY